MFDLSGHCDAVLGKSPRRATLNEQELRASLAAWRMETAAEAELASKVGLSLTPPYQVSMQYIYCRMRRGRIRLICWCAAVVNQVAGITLADEPLPIVEDPASPSYRHSRLGMLARAKPAATRAGMGGQYSHGFAAGYRRPAAPYDTLSTGCGQLMTQAERLLQVRQTGRQNLLSRCAVFNPSSF
jgi:hypothetical protein